MPVLKKAVLDELAKQEELKVRLYIDDGHVREGSQCLGSPMLLQLACITIVL